MTNAFGFEHNGKRYRVDGDYGIEGAGEFRVTRQLDRSELHTRVEAQSHVKIEGVISATSKSELASKLEASYPGLSAFSQC